MTAYEMRISDWSSDVCSSDLVDRLTSVLLRDLGGRAADLVTHVDDDGTVAVEGEAIGRLDGFRFKVDATARLAEKKMLLAAAERRLPKELHRRARSLAEAGNDAFALCPRPGSRPGVASAGRAPWRGEGGE